MDATLLGVACLIAGFIAGMLWGAEGFKRRQAAVWRNLGKRD